MPYVRQKVLANSPCLKCGVAFYVRAPRAATAQYCCCEHAPGRPKVRKHTPTTKTCLCCGKEFTCTTVYAIQHQVLCSRTCVGAVRAEKSLVNWACPGCGGEFVRTKHQALARKYCSYSCSNKATGEGARNGSWKGGSAKWWKQRARERDGFTCQFPECGVTHKGKMIHAHHKIPRSSGGPDTLDNLITLCEKHHKIVERRLLSQLLTEYPDAVTKICTSIYADLSAIGADKTLKPTD